MGQEVNAPDLGPGLNMVRQAANAMTASRLSVLGVITLGELIRKLKKAKTDAKVRYDFCDLVPGELASYRGFYDQLALGWSERRHYASDAVPTAGSLLNHCEAAVDQIFQGYKGGDFKMDADTAVWVDNWGEWTSTGIVGVKFPYESTVILRTKRCET